MVKSTRSVYIPVGHNTRTGLSGKEEEWEGVEEGRGMLKVPEGVEGASQYI